MLEVIVGVALTALLGGLLVPRLKERLDRRSEQYHASVELVETLASSLWTYWKLALRVAYYGRQGRKGHKDYRLALLRWDNDESWQNGNEIQIQVSRSKRLLPGKAQQKLDQAQREVVDYLDREIRHLRHGGTRSKWETFYNSLMNEKRAAIDHLLTEVTEDLKIQGASGGRAGRKGQTAVPGVT
jgi:hypothetical protein